MNSFNYKDIEIKHPKSGVAISRVVENADAVVVHMTLQKGEGLVPHITPVDVKFFILEGDVTVQVGDEKKEFPAGTVIESPKDIVHNITNKSDKIAKLLVMKTPNPEKAQYI